MAKRKPKRKTGPVPKLEDAKLRNRVLSLIRRGNPLRLVCHNTGIAFNTLQTYKRNNPKFAAELRRARAEGDMALVTICRNHAKKDPRIAWHLLVSRVPEFRQANQPQQHVHAHAHIEADPESLRTELIGILGTLRDRAGAGEAPRITESGGGSVIDVEGVESASGDHADDADAATVRFPQPDLQ